MKPPVPENEKARLETLRQYEILDTDPEESFNDLTRLAAYICNTPIALITLVDENRQWFKSKVGMSQKGNQPGYFLLCLRYFAGWAVRSCGMRLMMSGSEQTRW